MTLAANRFDRLWIKLLLAASIVGVGGLGQWFLSTRSRGGATQPRYLECLQGEFVEDSDLVFRLAPFTWLRSYYPENPRGYFRRAESPGPQVGAVNSTHQPPAGEPFVVDYHLNRFGYRERDVDPAAAPGVLRIACLGDSFTFGAGVRAEDAFPRVLEARLNQEAERFDGRYEVLNFGMIYYSTDIERQVYRQDVRRFRPQIVLLVMCWNDHVTTREETELVRRAEGLEGRGGYLEQYEALARRTSYDRCIEELRGLARDVRADGAQFCVAIFQNDDVAAWERLARAVLPAMNEERVPAFNVRSQLISASCFGVDSYVSSDDHHPNERAHSAMGSALADMLSQQGWLP